RSAMFRQGGDAPVVLSRIAHGLSDDTLQELVRWLGSEGEARASVALGLAQHYNRRVGTRQWLNRGLLGRGGGRRAHATRSAAPWPEAAQGANRASTRTKVYATIYEGFGTPQAKVTRKTVTLTAGKEMHQIATVVVGEAR